MVAGDWAAACSLLRSCSLPVEDVAEDQLEHFIGIYDGEELVALGGLEPYEGAGLLRSVCVRPASRGRGLAGAIVDALERRACEEGLEQIFLLTETAAAYFERRGYRRESRDAAPPAIAASSQFTQVCPASAVFMAKSLISSSRQPGG